MENVIKVLSMLDWMGYALLFLGLIYVSMNKKSGWLLQSFASIVLMIWGIAIHHYGVVVWNILFLVGQLSCYFNYDIIREMVLKNMDRNNESHINKPN